MPQGKLPEEERQRRQQARSKLAYAIRRGLVVKPANCQDCGSDGPQVSAHHKYYDRPLDVAWVCLPCRRKRQALGECVFRGKLEPKAQRKDAVVRVSVERMRGGAERELVMAALRERRAAWWRRRIVKDIDAIAVWMAE